MFSILWGAPEAEFPPGKHITKDNHFGKQLLNLIKEVSQKEFKNFSSIIPDTEEVLNGTLRLQEEGDIFSTAAIRVDK